MFQPLTAARAMPSVAFDHTPTEYGGDFDGRRHFIASVVPAPADSPVEEYLAGHDATPEQAAGMREMTRIVMESENPSAMAARVLELIEQERAAKDCDALNGQCMRHEDDNGTIIHRGPTHRERVADDDDLLTHTLIQWGDGRPSLEFVGGGTWPDLDLPVVDALIDAVEKQLAALRDSRAHLAAALGVAPPTQPPEQQQARPATGETDGQVSA